MMNNDKKAIRNYKKARVVVTKNLQEANEAYDTLKA